METWTPNLADAHGPRYRAIAEALASDIESGRLPAGSRLPTHRDLAYRLKVTVGTVSRAYSEAERRGLIGGEVGRGTFIRARPEPVLPAPAPDDMLNMAVNVPSGGSEANELSRTLMLLSASPRLAGLLGYQPHVGMPEHRIAVARMLEEQGIAATPERTILTAGAQHALTMALTAILRPGDTLGCEALTYGGVRAAARLHHLKLRGLPMDEQGLCPEGFEAACREGLKAIYCVPTLHNPTGIVWPIERRRAILEIAERHDVAVIEDDVYGFLADDAPPTLHNLAPHRVFHLNSTSKSLAPSLRIGCLVAPARAAAQIANGVRTTVWMAPPLMAEVVRLWVEDGTAARLVEEKRQAGAARQALARAILDRHGIGYQRGHANAFHLWIPLPEPWHDDSFVAAAREQSVVVSPAWSFATGRRQTDAIRISLGAPNTIGDIERGVHLLADLMSSEMMDGGVI